LFKLLKTLRKAKRSSKNKHKSLTIRTHLRNKLKSGKHDEAEEYLKKLKKLKKQR
jgi:hypothetical protein